MYARGYRTWFNLWELASGDRHLPRQCLSCLQTAFPNHPHFPENLNVDRSFSNTALVKGKSTWVVTDDLDHLPSFENEAIFQVAWDRPTTVVLTSDLRRATTTLPDIFDVEHNHIPILIQAWAYILSARWTELIPGAHLSQSGHQAYQDPTNGLNMLANVKPPIAVYIGEVSDDAAHWWNCVLSVRGSWQATIRNSNGDALYSPWAIKLTSEQPFAILAKVEAKITSSHTPPTSTMARRYLSEYSHLHGIADQKQAALAAALLIPVAKYHHRPIELAIPKISHVVDHGEKERICPPMETEDKVQFDRLMALSCSPVGSKALLASIFFEPDVTSNVCGIWLQGSLAFLNTMKDPHALLQTLMKRDPELGALWLGAFITGVHHRCLQEARAAWWKIDLNAAAWTETFMSFVQEPVPALAPDAGKLSRADEARLLYLCHDVTYAVAPLFPFAPFGSTALFDTNLDVHEHAICGRHHCLGYAGFTWVCQGGKQMEQSRHDPPLTTIRLKHGQVTENGHGVDVDYNGIDSEDENSEMVTRNIFTWLRGQDGFPVAERAIRQHEWIDNLDEDDDAPIQGEVLSTVGGNLHGWILKVSTQRANSI
ncbi:hypothetical protein EDB81DRAFT_897615 [Dactylonectria macrodidyma]|uniref:Uncharacterized protein n=1 Tax=Dactylonectria macrodidyma TaxID=307937 RepID=A0A9P9FUM7_9HYPO|nr:hypothetical protein EDB81DRAFT_897615 [Dactylonectria macrodidyma]